MSWYKGLKGKVRFNEPLSKHTTFRVGSCANRWIEPYNLDDLKNLLKKAKSNKIKYLVVGFGSNLLIKKKKIPLVIHLGSPNFKNISVEGNSVLAGAGVSLNNLVNIAIKNNLGGIEFLSGIPASLGGAIMMNAGVNWPKRLEIGDYIQCIEAIDKNGNVKILRRKDLEFGYRRSNLTKFIITKAKLKLHKRRRYYIKKERNSFLAYRRQKQDLSYPSAGCIFRNPSIGSAGRLIDACGLKGMHVGGAFVSNKHANFIINKRNATAGDVLNLIKLIQKQVRDKFKINLKPEVRVV